MREKLIELLESVPQPELLYGQPLIGVCKVADHLIANGVTFATDNNVGGKWIPVSERLPDGECLAISMEHGSSYKEQWIGWIYKDEITDEYVCEADGVCLCNVTHWMQLPQPPKEES